jgi:hypothetical protein
MGIQCDVVDDATHAPHRSGDRRIDAAPHVDARRVRVRETARVAFRALARAGRDASPARGKKTRERRRGEFEFEFKFESRRRRAKDGDGANGDGANGDGDDAKTRAREVRATRGRAGAPSAGARGR